VHFLIAFAVTVIGTFFAWYFGGIIPLNGIDDAAITRAYSENIANGHGFVYNIGGERVEGATSLLWTLVVALAYLFKSSPELLILAISFSFTLAAVWVVLKLIVLLAQGAEVGSRVALICGSVALIGLPGFFVWSVWSMMETPLWSFALTLLVWRICVIIADAGSRDLSTKIDPMMMLAAIILPLIRPEGAAFSLGLLALAILLTGLRHKGLLMAGIATVISIAGVTGFRMIYFGFPFPNTYYAKVSSDRVQGILDGLKYLISFVVGLPFAEILLVATACAALLAAWHMIKRDARPVHRMTLVVSATVFGVLGTYSVLGGDHFVLWRFFQPVTPLMVVLPSVIFVAIFDRLRSQFPSSNLALGCVIAAFGWVAITLVGYHQSRFGVIREYSLSARGEQFGRYLNSFESRPSLGVIAAGGIALQYDGEILDLMGLNWVKMAHANPVKEGFRNHASFDIQVFWENPPELFSLFHKPGCDAEEWVELTATRGGLKGILASERFRENYLPIRFAQPEGGCYKGFGRKDWLVRSGDGRITIVPWIELTLL